MTKNFKYPRRVLLCRMYGIHFLLNDKEVAEFLETLRSYGLEVIHDKEWRLIKIKGTVTFVDFGLVSEIVIEYGDTNVSFTEFSDVNALDIRKGDSLKRVYLEKAVTAHYAEGYLILKY